MDASQTRTLADRKWCMWTAIRGRHPQGSLSTRGYKAVLVRMANTKMCAHA